MNTPAIQVRPVPVVFAGLDALGDSLARQGRALAAAYAASPIAKRRDAKARLVAVVNAYALAPSLAQVADSHAPTSRTVARALVPSPATRSALATCHASNAPGSFRVAITARGPKPT